MPQCPYYLGVRIKPFFYRKNMSFLLEQTRIKRVSIERGPLNFYLIRRRVPGRMNIPEVQRYFSKTAC